MRPRGIAIITLALASLCMTGCGEGDLDSDSVSSSSCGRDARAFDESDLDDATACFGDTLMLRLDPEGEGMNKTVHLRVPQAGRVRFCLDLIDQHPHRLELLDAGGETLSSVRQGDGCAEVDLPAGRHTLRLSNGRQADPTADGYFVFVRPDREAPSAAEGSAAGATPLLGTYTLSSYCPGCDLRGVDLSSSSMLCFDQYTGDCNVDNPANAKCTVLNTKWFYQYGLKNDLSNAQFGGAKFLGSWFFCVNFRGAQFWDDQFGQAQFGVGPSCCNEGFPPQQTTFETAQLHGASFRNVDLTKTVLSCSVAGPDEPVWDPSILIGADLRGANLSNVVHSIDACPWGSDPNNPYPVRLDLTDALLDANTDLQNTDLRGANLTGWNWHATDWSTANFQQAILAEGDMSGIDFTASKYTGTFFVADKNVDRFADVDFTGVNFTGAKLAALDLTFVHMPSANFTSANLHGVPLDGAYFMDANFTGADLGSVTATEVSPALFNRATMVRAYLKQASLPGSFFRGAVLAPANLANADLSGAFFEVDPTCRDAQGNCIASNPTCVCQAATLSGSFMLNTILSGAHMTDTVLDYVSWYNVSPAAAVATGANAFLTGASFNLADLPGLDLTDARLQGAVLTNTQLIGANLTGAQLGINGSTRTNLSTANLRGANLTNANLANANMQNAGASAVAESEVFIEVLADPDHYQQPQVYQYFAVNRPPTILGSGTTVTAVTDFATCPSGANGPCGPITNPSWVAPNPPQEPDCTTTVDSQGNVIAVSCSSSRHPSN